MHSVQSSCGRKRLNTLFLAFATLTIVSTSLASDYTRHPLLINDTPVYHNSKPIYFFSTGQGKVIYCIAKTESTSEILGKPLVLKLIDATKQQQPIAAMATAGTSSTSQTLTLPSTEHVQTSASTTTTPAPLATPQNNQQPPVSGNSTTTTTTTTTTHLGSPPSPRPGHSVASTTLPLIPHTQASASSTTTITSSSSSSSSISDNPATPAQLNQAPLIPTSTRSSAQPIQPLGNVAAAITPVPTVVRYNPIITIGAAGAGLTLEQIAKKNGDTEKKAFAKGLVATGATSLLGQQGERTPETTAKQLAADLATYTIGHYVIAYVWPKQKTSETPTEILPEAATQTTETVQPKLVEKKGCPVTSWLRSTILTSRK